MTKFSDAEEIDDVERCRQVRRQIESQHPGIEAYLAWARAIDQKLRRPKRSKRKGTTLAGRSVVRRGKQTTPRKSAKSRNRS